MSKLLDETRAIALLVKQQLLLRANEGEPISPGDALALAKLDVNVSTLEAIERANELTVDHDARAEADTDRDETAGGQPAEAPVAGSGRRRRRNTGAS